MEKQAIQIIPYLAFPNDTQRAMELPSQGGAIQSYRNSAGALPALGSVSCAAVYSSSS